MEMPNMQILDDPISDVLDMEQREISTDLNDHITVVMPDDTKENDHKTARETLYKMLGTGESVLGSSMAMLQECPNPRAVEVVTGLIKTMAEISGDLLKLHPEVKTERIVNNNSVYTGTVETLLGDIDNNG